MEEKWIVVVIGNTPYIVDGEYKTEQEAIKKAFGVATQMSCDMGVCDVHIMKVVVDKKIAHVPQKETRAERESRGSRFLYEIVDKIQD